MEFEDTLAICIERLAKGESVESCLERFPEEAAQLEPLLRMAQLIRSQPKPVLTDAGFRHGREAVAQAAATNKAFALVHGPADSTILLVEESARRESARRARSRPLFAWPALASAAIAACLLVVVMLAASQSPSVIPGSRMYTVKLLGEQGQGLLMAAVGDEAQWHATLAERRLAELRALESTGETVTAAQVEILISEVDEALQASATMPDAERARLRASLRQSLEEAAHTLTVSGDAQVALQQTQYTIISAEDNVQVAAALQADTTPAETTESTRSAEAEAAVATHSQPATTQPGQAQAPTVETVDPFAVQVEPTPTNTADTLAPQTEEPIVVQQTEAPVATEPAPAIAAAPPTSLPTETAALIEQPALDEALAASAEAPAQEAGATEAPTSPPQTSVPTRQFAPTATWTPLAPSTQMTGDGEGDYVSEQEPVAGGQAERAPTWTPVPRPTASPAIAAQPPTLQGADSAATLDGMEAATAGADIPAVDSADEAEPAPALAAVAEMDGAPEPEPVGENVQISETVEVATEEPPDVGTAELASEVDSTASEPAVELNEESTATQLADGDETATETVESTQIAGDATPGEEVAEAQAATVATEEPVVAEQPGGGTEIDIAVLPTETVQETASPAATSEVSQPLASAPREDESIVSVDVPSRDTVEPETDIPPTDEPPAPEQKIEGEAPLEPAPTAQTLPTATATFTPTATFTATPAPPVEAQATAQPAPKRGTGTNAGRVVLPTATPTPTVIVPNTPTSAPATEATETPEPSDAEDATPEGPLQPTPTVEKSPLLPTPTPSKEAAPVLPTPTP